MIFLHQKSKNIFCYLPVGGFHHQHMEIKLYCFLRHLTLPTILIINQFIIHLSIVGCFVLSCFNSFARPPSEAHISCIPTSLSSDTWIKLCFIQATHTWISLILVILNISLIILEHVSFMSELSLNIYQ